MRRNVNILASLDWFTILLFVVLVIFGWINIYSAEYNEEYSNVFTFSQRYGKQFVWISAALVLAILVTIIDSKFFSLIAFVIYLLTIFLLILVLVFGSKIHGAKSWFQLGSFYFQPSEFAKFGTSLALAKYLSGYNISIKKFITWLIIVAIIGAPVGLIALQPDFGSILVYFALLFMLYREGFPGWLMAAGFLIIILFIITLVANKLLILAILAAMAFILYWILSKSLKQVFFGALAYFIISGAFYFIHKFLPTPFSLYKLLIAATGFTSFIFIIVALRKKLSKIYLAIVFMVISLGYSYAVDYAFYNVLKEHQRDRINILLGIEEDPLGIGYNVEQSKIAIGSGGFSGKGFLQGTQTKLDFVPEQSTDFIFCTVGEEWGFIGTMIIVILFTMLLLRLIYLAERQRSVFSRIYGYCVFSILFFHIAVNIGMTIGLFPVIGIPLPFLSYGGSSLWAFTLLLFVFLRLDASRMELLH